MNDDGGPEMAETDSRLVGRFANALAARAGQGSLTSRLCGASIELLAADGAAVTLTTDTTRQLMLATDETAQALEGAQDVAGQGPSLDAVRDREVVIARFEPGAADRWPLLLDQRPFADFCGTIIATPLLGDQTLVGVLSVYRVADELPTDRLTAAFLGHTVGTAMLLDPALDHPDALSPQTWTSMAVVHQATGMVVAQVGVHQDDAVALLRAQAFSQNVTLDDVATQVVNRSINFRDFTIKGD